MVGVFDGDTNVSVCEAKPIVLDVAGTLSVAFRISDARMVGATTRLIANVDGSSNVDVGGSIVDDDGNNSCSSEI